jgi:hypothetical protein
MIEITNIEYRERSPDASHPAAQPYKCILFSVRLHDDTPARFLVDDRAIRMLDAPGSKGAISRTGVEKIVIRRHSATIFSVVCFLRPGLVQRARSRIQAILQGAAPAYPEEIGTALQGFDAVEVGQRLRDVGYNVELVAVSSAHQPMAP